MQTRLSTLALVTAVGVSALVQPWSTPPATQDPDPDLESRVSNLEALIVQHQLDLQAAQDQLAEVALIADGLVEACWDLDQAMVISRKNGFEWAGPNPQAKTDMLDGLRLFARQVRTAAGIEDPIDPDTEAGGGSR